jgi:hypothetical protein
MLPQAPGKDVVAESLRVAAVAPIIGRENKHAAVVGILARIETPDPLHASAQQHFARISAVSEKTDPVS